MFPIGVILEAFRLPAEEGVLRAAALGVQGLQIRAGKGKLSGKEWTPAWRKELLTRVQDQGLEVAALCGDLGKGFGDPALNPELVDESKRILDLALEMETKIVTTHIGLVPEDPNHPRWAIMQEACRSLAEHADSLNAHFAVETGPEPAQRLKDFLDSLNSKGVAVNMDPANLVMVLGEDAVQAVHILGDYIVHTHAKDGRLIDRIDPEIIYGHKKPDKPLERRPYLEVPLGEGQVPFPAYLDALTQVGYKGFLTIEREVGESPAEDIGRAVGFLREHM